MSGGPGRPGREAGGVAVAPALEPVIESVAPSPALGSDPRRIVFLSLVAIGVALLAVGAAEVLTRLIGLITNLVFYGRVSLAIASPATNHLGLFVLVVPVVGAVIVGLMARFGSPAIRGHGIPEAMEQILLNESRIPVRITFLKPLSAAISIGTGGPFGAEGPIIATGGALGSLVGQMLHVSADERKTILAAGAAAGMAAIFGTPVAAVLLAVELLLFEYRPRSLIPVALASATATAGRMAIHGPAPVFPMPLIAAPGGWAMVSYVLMGAVVGFLAAWVTKALYALEDRFALLPVHWMWWPALGAVVVGLVGWLEPRTLGVGYDNIEDLVAGRLVGTALVTLVGLKLVSWLVALASGTSGGTLAPLFTIGGGAGALLAAGLDWVVPGAGVDVRIAALVGMAAIFAGASHALLASVVFAFEITRQPLGLLPLLGGSAAAYLISLLHSRQSIMTEKLARRGTRVGVDYAVDYLDQILVGAIASADLVVLRATQTVGEIRDWMATDQPGSTHQGFPIVEAGGNLVGVLTRRDLLAPGVGSDVALRQLIRRAPIVVYQDSSCREAADHMVRERVGRLVVVSRTASAKPLGIVTRSDLLFAHERRLAGTEIARPDFSLAG